MKIKVLVQLLEVREHADSTVTDDRIAQCGATVDVPDDVPLIDAMPLLEQELNTQWLRVQEAVAIANPTNAALAPEDPAFVSGVDDDGPY